jgi:outer membrane protein OmpA-like peptidoglycan-associated protein
MSWKAVSTGGVLLFLHSVLLAQNLVSNGGFEEYYTCPGSYNLGVAGKIAPGWVSPTPGTPDLFNLCSKGDAKVPSNWAGYSKANSGNGYAGIYVYTTLNSNYREYLQALLVQPLEKGVVYRVEFYYKLSSHSKYSIDRVGVLLSDSSFESKKDDIIHRPTYEQIQPSAYDKRTTGTWIKFARQYEAKGGERFVTIGNFSPDKETKNYYIHFSHAREPMLDKGAYYYVDDVRVVRVSEPVVAPPMLTGYPTLKENENYVLKNVNFAFNDYALLPSSDVELANLVQVLKYHPEWKVVLTGHTDDVGTDAYNLELSRKRAEAVADFIIKKGINPVRVKTSGVGKQYPLVVSKDETSRAVNRRVELKFVSTY